MLEAQWASQCGGGGCVRTHRPVSPKKMAPTQGTIYSEIYTLSVNSLRKNSPFPCCFDVGPYNGVQITNLELWKVLAPPKSANQWVDGRSAKETARAWLESFPQAIPAEITRAVENHPDFGPILQWHAEPEARLRFDNFPGEPRNSDVAVYCKDARGPYLIAVEAKADEPFGETVEKTFGAALERKLSNPRSNGITRIERLATGLLGPRHKGEPATPKLRYQLLTACAGALCEAKRHDCDRTIMLVQEFMSDKTDDLKHQRNFEDLKSMIERLSHSEYPKADMTSIWGPFLVPGDPLISDAPKLYIGKVTRNLRRK